MASGTKKQPRKAAGRPAGKGVRPRVASGPGAGKISLSCSPALKAVVDRLAVDLDGTIADVVREGIRLLAEARGLPRPPLR